MLSWLSLPAPTLSDDESGKGSLFSIVQLTNCSYTTKLLSVAFLNLIQDGLLDLFIVREQRFHDGRLPICKTDSVTG
jgi:hypothetical protein